MISKEYFADFLALIQAGCQVESFAHNHGYFREVLCDGGILYYPEHGSEDYYSISVTPGLNQTLAQISRDLAKNRILVVSEAANAQGCYVTLEDDSHYMTLTGDLGDDVITYCHRVIKAIIGVTGPAQTNGLTPHDYITQLAD